jgi:hypothetical protein
MSLEDTAAEYLAAWNERDVDAIRGHLERSVDSGVCFADPANHTVGINELEAMIRRARSELPDASYERTSSIDGGHDRRYRYTWAVHTPDDTIVGMDCTTVDDRYRFVRIDGFFGELR